MSDEQETQEPEPQKLGICEKLGGVDKDAGRELAEHLKESTPGLPRAQR